MTSSPWSWLEPTPAFAQDDDGDDGPDMAPGGEGFPVGPFPGIGGNDDQLDPKAMKELQRELMKMNRPGAGGASLVVFALLGMVLVWAPKNEISCLWIGLNAGTFEMEYVYFCGFKIGAEILGSVIGAQGYEVTSEIAHALGAILGFGVAAAFVKLNWVDCENWDLFAYAQNKHGAVANVGAWQDTVALASLREKKVVVNTDDDGLIPESIPQPGVDGLLGTADDVALNLTNFTREIEIREWIVRGKFEDVRELRFRLGEASAVHQE